MLTLLVQGFGKSLEIFTLTLLGSLPLGLLVMFGRRSRVAPLRWLVKLFISVMRGTPLMLQLMVVYYGPFLLFDFTPPGNWRFGAVIVGFVINYAAYFAEIYRAGYESIPVGQFEAAQVLGCDPQWIRLMARERPEKLGFPVCCTSKHRVKIPREPFIKFVGGEL